MFQFRHALPRPDVIAGLLVAEGLSMDAYPPDFPQERARILVSAQAELTSEREKRRADVRDMLRNGVYKPTGRAKPATEYLLRAAREGTFPQINAGVDVANLLCLDSLLPVSMWDVDLAASRNFVLRYGRAGEAYIFNSAGQTIALHDLLVVAREEDDRALVNPVKDSLATKTIPQTTRAAVIVYTPSDHASLVEDLLGQFEHWLRQCGSDVRVGSGILHPGETLFLDLA